MDILFSKVTHAQNLYGYTGLSAEVSRLRSIALTNQVSSPYYPRGKLVKRKDSFCWVNVAVSPLQFCLIFPLIGVRFTHGYLLCCEMELPCAKAVCLEVPVPRKKQEGKANVVYMPFKGASQ